MNYPKYRTFQLIIPMLKAHDIRHIVISPGSRMREFVIAVEEDPFFTTYDVTDERSASYFAMGIAQELNVPVVITCTSSTATTNYVPGVTEAFYQNVPIVVLTGDRDPYMLGQQEDQMIDQVGMYDRVVRKSVTLPIVRTEADEWYCQRLLNEALLELDHHKKGPVHINVPVPAVIYWNKEKEITEYPAVRPIRRYEISPKFGSELDNKVKELVEAKRILVIAGQCTTKTETEMLDEFFDKYNCVIHSEHMGNIQSEGHINIASISEGINKENWGRFLPDIVISFHGTLAISRNLKETLRVHDCRHWLIDEEGTVVDAYKNLETVFESTPEEFFRYFNAHAPKGAKNNEEYSNLWKNVKEAYQHPEIPYSNVYAIKNLIPLIPQDSNLHLSILNSIRISQFYDLPKGVKVYANVGTDGIDGCMSTFFGQAAVCDKENFLVIGDLSFFYDMNSLRIKHNRGNCHILLINNFGGNEFYQQPIVPTTPQGLGASHGNCAQAWAESVGFRYLSSHNEEEYQKDIQEFVKTNQQTPVLMEVFTDQMTDRETVFSIKGCAGQAVNETPLWKSTVKSVLGEKGIKNIKTILGKK